ncbi:MULTISPECIES: hypothetical protein [Pseudomonas]|jgi:hypothetical protein|uniref:hypothetical protein n=1 Tax=Pseudomonas TaxID=286 RepID=UPI0009E467C3|nr:MULTISPECIES: hypothetical protein [Pseudomonas]MBB4812604.1 hypothetical protein [Pseudomonas rhodesiae]MDN6862613.1 hypothetical protein [Pseudomonas rhodesiae]POA62395.1 hypothetical protein C1885_00860 [Pseudomonas sp. GW531-R1]UVL10175.1 hypothetical protein LOY39_05655 [Pseudomonas rhodesiae]WHT80038.1 hypothetical protein QMY54_04853 [Pseudomonas rhodesiae]
MSTEQQLVAVVSAANRLTNTVENKLGEIDKALADAREKYESQISGLTRKIPRLAVTRNFHMAPDTTGALIDGWYVHSQVTATKTRTITQLSQSAGRSQADVDFMRQVQADVSEQFPGFDIWAAEYWRNPINVWQMKWSEGSVSPWLAFPCSIDTGRLSGATPVSLNTHMTAAAFVRVVEGAVDGTWTTGNEKGKWRWCSLGMDPAGFFSHYMHVHPMRISNSGLIEVMLAGACTGVVNHPVDWGTMLALG